MRLFAAVWPSPALISRLRQLERPPRPGLRWTTEDQWHVTLRFYGSVGPGDLAAISESIAGAAASSGPVTADSGPRPRPLGRHVWVLPVGGLAPLASLLGPSERDFLGHITLARVKRRVAFSGLPAPEISERWTVPEVCLVESDLRPSGSRYRVLGRWPLVGG